MPSIVVLDDAWTILLLKDPFSRGLPPRRLPYRHSSKYDKFILTSHRLQDSTYALNLVFVPTSFDEFIYEVPHGVYTVMKLSRFRSAPSPDRSRVFILGWDQTHSFHSIYWLASGTYPVYLNGTETVTAKLQIMIGGAIAWETWTLLNRAILEAADTPNRYYSRRLGMNKRRSTKGDCRDDILRCLRMGFTPIVGALDPNGVRLRASLRSVSVAQTNAMFRGYWVSVQVRVWGTPLFLKFQTETEEKHMVVGCQVEYFLGIFHFYILQAGWDQCCIALFLSRNLAVCMSRKNCSSWIREWIVRSHFFNYSASWLLGRLRLRVGRWILKRRFARMY